MDKPVISIIIPVYNLEKLVENTLCSVAAQTCENIEIIAVNDGSKDKSGEILDNFALKEPRLKVIHKENGGVTSARLEGIKAAKGEYIGFVDGDDEIDADMYELLLNNAMKYEADISHCGYEMVFPSRTDLYYGTGELSVQDTTTGVKDLIEGKKIEPGLCNKLYKAELLKSICPKMDGTIKINEDLLMNFYLFSKSRKSVFEDVCKYRYLVRESSAATSSVNIHKLEDPLKVSTIILDECKNDKVLYTAAARLQAIKLIALATHSTKVNPETVKPSRKKARKELRKFVLSYCKLSGISKAAKLQCLWAAFLPQTYGLVHSLYSALNGNNKKYEVK